MSEVFLEMRGITKKFGDFYANDQIDLSVKHGTIHAILGENGAGKTTLLNVLYGMSFPNAGEIYLDGRRVIFHNPSDAIASGIGMVHQHFMLVSRMTVLENIILGLKVGGHPFYKKKKIAAELHELSEKYGLMVDPYKRISELSVGAQQRVEILKALYRNARLLILDEPTAVLTPQETEDFFRTLSMLKEDGRSIILISHKMSEIMEHTDAVTVLRNGKKVADIVTADTSEQELSSLMIGRGLNMDVYKKTSMPETETLLSVRDVTLAGKGGRDVLSDISFTVHRGEILGIAGVDGNGQNELAEVLVRVRKQTSGTIDFNGESIDKKGIRKRHEVGIAYIPSDRRADGLVVSATISENIALRTYYEEKYARYGILRQQEMTRHAEELVESFRIKAGGTAAYVSSLSGGNQQKVILARELSGDAALVVACLPTRGLDIGASEYVCQKLMELRNSGGSVILVSTDLDEIIALSDRIAVMFQGRIMGIVENSPELKRETIGMMMCGKEES